MSEKSSNSETRVMSYQDMKIPSAVLKQLDHYVYIYTNPLDGKVFYIGKGQGRRVLDHLTEEGNTETTRKIRQIRKAGLEPRIEILAHGFEDSDSAESVEAAAIDLLQVTELTNRVHGKGSRKWGRIPLEDLIAIYQKKQIDITEPCVLIRISKAYRSRITPTQLYDATRSSWVVGKKKREQAKFALAVFEGVVREVYEISTWVEAGETYREDNPNGNFVEGRWEFVGKVADETIRSKYRNGYVGDIFSHGARNPITYCNIE